MALKSLGEHPVWLGFLGGAVGDYCEEQLRVLGIGVVAIKTFAATRVNVELTENSGPVTEVLGPGNAPEPAACQEMLQILAERLTSKWKGAIVVLSGSLPAGMPAEFYAEVTRVAHERGSKVFLDSSGTALSSGISATPDFLKINRDEAEALLAKSIDDVKSAILSARSLLDWGVQSAAITMGAAGVVWISREHQAALIGRGPHLNPTSTVGCGDATLAGFIYGSAQGLTPEELVKLAIACGAANCMANFPGMISASVVEKLKPEIVVEAA
jgi:1-phosphofructokinase family hexose kinase